MRRIRMGRAAAARGPAGRGMRAGGLRGGWLLPVVLLCAAGAAWGDSVTVEGLPYAGVEVIAADAYTIVFRPPSGRIVSKPVAKVSRLQIEGAGRLNEAEAHAGRQQWDAALAAYAKAAETAPEKWQSLIAGRRLWALKKAGRLGAAVEAWLALYDQAGQRERPRALALAPSEPAAKGSEANGRAIKVLEERQGQAEGDLLAAVRSLLLKLYRHEGQTEKAGKLAAAMTGASGAAAGDEVGRSGPADAEALDAALNAYTARLEAGETDAVLSFLAQNLHAFTAGQLPRALLLRGRARWQRYQQTKDPALLRQAGLDCMRVVAYAPRAAEAPEALYLAGRINRALGNEAAARRAWDEAARGEGPFARKSREALRAGGGLAEPGAVDRPASTNPRNEER